MIPNIKETIWKGTLSFELLEVSASLKIEIDEKGELINQTFQLAPSSQNNMRFVNTMDDVAKEIVFFDTPFFSKDMSVLWVKNTKNEIKTYELNEIVAKDEKDLMIESLKIQLDEMNKTLKEMKNNAKPVVTNDDEPIESEEPASVPVSRTSKTTKK